MNNFMKSIYFIYNPAGMIGQEILSYIEDSYNYIYNALYKEKYFILTNKT